MLYISQRLKTCSKLYVAFFPTRFLISYTISYKCARVHMHKNGHKNRKTRTKKKE